MLPGWCSCLDTGGGAWQLTLEPLHDDRTLHHLLISDTGSRMSAVFILILMMKSAHFWRSFYDEVSTFLALFLWRGQHIFGAIYLFVSILGCVISRFMTRSAHFWRTLSVCQHSWLRNFSVRGFGAFFLMTRSAYFWRSLTDQHIFGALYLFVSIFWCGDDAMRRRWSL